MSPTTYRLWTAAILLVALGLRLAAGAWWQQRLPAGQKFAFGDSEGYWELARGMAAGEPFQYGSPDSRIFRTPGYPFLLSLLYRTYGGEPPVYAGRALSALLGVASVATIMRIALQLFSPQVSLIAGLWTAIYPEAIAMGVFVLSEAPFCLLMLCQLSFWIAAWQSDCPRHRLFLGFLAGVFGGLATLMRPSWLLFLPFAAGIGLLFTQRRVSHIVVASAMLAGLCCTMLPWWVRNYGIAGRFVPTTLQVGASLYDGLSPKADGSSEMSFVAPFVAEQREADRVAGDNLVGTFEERLDKRMQAASIEWTKAHPGSAIRLAGVKFLRMWNVLPNAAEMKSPTIRLALAVTYAPTMLLALWGLVRFGRRGWSHWLLILPAIYFTLLHCIFVSSIRYRQPAMPLLIILASSLLWELIHRGDRNDDTELTQPVTT